MICSQSLINLAKFFPLKFYLDGEYPDKYQNNPGFGQKVSFSGIEIMTKKRAVVKAGGDKNQMQWDKSCKRN